jgi:hypothetical protein
MDAAHGLIRGFSPFAPFAALFLHPSHLDERVAPQLNRLLHDSTPEPGINLRETTTAFPHT